MIHIVLHLVYNKTKSPNTTNYEFEYEYANKLLTWCVLRNSFVEFVLDL